MLCRCERRTKGQKAHLILRNLNEYDIAYLEALLDKDTEKIHVHESRAKASGYGPLAHCNFVAAPREQKTLCREWLIWSLAVPVILIYPNDCEQQHGIVTQREHLLEVFWTVRNIALLVLNSTTLIIWTNVPMCCLYVATHTHIQIHFLRKPLKL